MKYCINCGGELLKQSDTKYTCTNCRREQFNNPKSAVALLLFDGDKVILTRRAHQPDKDKLDPIGGFVDYGENIEKALLRELTEETTLTKQDIATPQYIHSGYIEYQWHGTNEPVVSSWFWAELQTDKTLTPQDDVSSFELFDLGDIPAQELAAPKAITIIKQAFKLKSQSPKNT